MQFRKSHRNSGERGKPSPPLQKGGENVTPSSHERNKQHAFDSFCKKVLKHEARDHYDEMKRQREREVSFSELSAQEMEQLFTVDKYFATEQVFNVLGREVVVNDELIAEALRTLPERKRDIILLAYFLEMSDRAIGEKLNLLRATVQYQRTSTLRELKKYLEENADEQ